MFTYFWTWFTWLIVWLCQETCVQMLSSFMSAGKYVADRFQPSLSRLSRRATLPLCRQRSGLFSRDHWKDRIMCRSWSLFKCRWKHLWNDIGMFAYLHTLIHTAFKSQKWFAWKTTEVHLIVCACNQLRPFEPICFPFVEFTSRPTVAGIGLGAEKLEGAHSFFSTAWGTSI